MKTIPPIDLTRQHQAIQEPLNAAMLAVMTSGRYIGGEAVRQFEEQFAQAVGVRHCITCNSGTDALYLSLRALGIGPGDEVITSPFTFIATAEAITMTGATPVFVDIDAATFNLDLNHIEAAIGPPTKAILPVHLFGQPVDMTQVMAIAQAHDLAVIEDCAQATGAMWNDQTVGSIGDIGCFSFFPTKNLGGCGDGGAMTTNDDRLAAAVRMLKEHGSRERYRHEAVGINSRLDAVQAAILTIKLDQLRHWNQQRQELAQRYHNLLGALPHIVLPQALPNGKTVWNQYTIRVKIPDSDSCTGRDRLREQLQTRGVGSMVYYPLPLHQQPVYQHLGHTPAQFPMAEQVCQEVLSLPMFPGLTGAEQQQVAYCLKDSLLRIHPGD